MPSKRICLLLLAPLTCAALLVSCPDSGSGPATTAGPPPDPVKPQAPHTLLRLRTGLRDLDAAFHVLPMGETDAGQRAWLESKHYDCPPSGTTVTSWLAKGDETDLVVDARPEGHEATEDPRVLTSSPAFPARALGALSQRIAEGARPRRVLLVLPTESSVQQRLDDVLLNECWVDLRKDFSFQHTWTPLGVALADGAARLEREPGTDRVTTTGAGPYRLRIQPPPEASSYLTVHLRTQAPVATLSITLSRGGAFPAELPPMLIETRADHWHRLVFPLPGEKGAPIDLLVSAAGDASAAGQLHEFRDWGHLLAAAPGGDATRPFRPATHRAPGEAAPQGQPLLPMTLENYPCRILTLESGRPRVLEPAPPDGGSLMLIVAAEGEKALFSEEIPLVFELALRLGERSTPLARVEMLAIGGEFRHRRQAMGLPSGLPPEARLEARMLAPRGIPEGLIAGFAFLD